MEAATALAPVGERGVSRRRMSSSADTERRRAGRRRAGRARGGWRAPAVAAAVPERVRPRRHRDRVGDRRPGAQRQNVFLTSRNLLNIVRFASENGIIAIGMTLVILTGGIDLSVGAVLALCAVASADLMMHHDLGTVPTIARRARRSAPWSAPINGLVITRLQIQSFIATLAMLGVARGVASLWAGGYAIPLSFGDGADLAPPRSSRCSPGDVDLLGLEVPAPVFYFLGVGLIAALASCVAPGSGATSTPSAATPPRRGCRASTSTACKSIGVRHLRPARRPGRAAARRPGQPGQPHRRQRLRAQRHRRRRHRRHQPRRRRRHRGRLDGRRADAERARQHPRPAQHRVRVPGDPQGRHHRPRRGAAAPDQPSAQARTRWHDRLATRSSHAINHQQARGESDDIKNHSRARLVAAAALAAPVLGVGRCGPRRTPGDDRTDRAGRLGAGRQRRRRERHLHPGGRHRRQGPATSSACRRPTRASRGARR